MSYSTMMFSTDSMNEMICKQLDYDTNDLIGTVKDLNLLLDKDKNWCIENNYKIVFDVNRNINCENIYSFISQIVLVDIFENGDFIPNTYAFVSYHHAGDPSLFEVICECMKIFKEKNINYNN